MEKIRKHVQLAQSASTLGAALLGFGIGAKWGANILGTFLIALIVVGAVIHIAGMYVIQMKDQAQAGTIAKVLWLSAWICLLSLVALFIYLSLASN